MLTNRLYETCDWDCLQTWHNPVCEQRRQALAIRASANDAAAPRINATTPHRAAYISSLRASTRPRYRAIKESYRTEQHKTAVWFWQGMFRPTEKGH